MRIGVLDVFASQQDAAGLEQLHDGFVGGEHLFAVVFREPFKMWPPASTRVVGSRPYLTPV